jgi:hypothetical protein
LPNPPTPTDPLGPIVTAIASLIAAMEALGDGPALRAYRSAIRRHGEEAAAEGGQKAMQLVFDSLRAAAPDRAEKREAIINAAWAGLPGWLE